MDYRIDLSCGENQLILAPDMPLALLRDGLEGFHSGEAAVTFEANASCAGAVTLRRGFGERKLAIRAHLGEMAPSEELAWRRKISAFADPARDCEITVRFGTETRRITAVPSAGAVFERDPIFGGTEVTLRFTAVHPYFEGTAQVEEGLSTNRIIAGVPCPVVNGGEVPCGALFTVTCTGAVVNPRIALGTGENAPFVEVTESLQAGDVAVIDTRQGSRGITVNGEECLSFPWESSFFSLGVGENQLVVSADSGKENMAVRAAYVPLYYGI